MFSVICFSYYFFGSRSIFGSFFRIIIFLQIFIKENKTFIKIQIGNMQTRTLISFGNILGIVHKRRYFI